MAELYRANNLFVLASENEGMSVAMLEAMASGLPIITTDTGGAHELLEDSENGFLINKGSTQDLVKRLTFYLDNPEVIAEHGRKSRQTVEPMGWRNVAHAVHGNDCDQQTDQSVPY